MEIKDLLETLANNVAFELKIDGDLADKIILFLDTDGMIDYAMLREMYED